MENETEENGMNIEEAAAGIATDIFGPTEEPEADAPEEAAVEQPEAETKPVEQVEAPVVRQAPGSWAKETHEIWAKLPPEAQAQIEHREKQMLDGLAQYKGDAGFGKQMRDAIRPYEQLISAQGVDAPRAVQVLLDAHRRLSTSSPSDKQAYFAHLAKQYGVELNPGAPSAADPPNQELLAVKEKLSAIESSLTARQQAELTEARARTASEVDAFASDPAHPYFEEVADDLVAMINIGMPLKDAYEKAVWANPVTRQKELTRIQTESEAKKREAAAKEAEAAKKAAGSNVRSRDTRRAPTESLGTMEDTMKSTLSEIRARTH